MTLIYCPKCDSANATDAPVCGLCGHALATGPQPKATQSIQLQLLHAQRLRDEKRSVERQLADIKREVFSGEHDPTTRVDTIPCPKCGRRIIPQWTYTGRKYLLVFEHFGVEGHGRSRFCPLCGVDVDQCIQEMVSRVKSLEREIAFVQLTPRGKAKEAIFDRIALLLVAVLAVLFMLLFVL